MPHVFGKTISFEFTPLVNNELEAVNSLVSARIFSTPPTNTQIDTPATAGFISEVTSWTSKGDYTKLITFPALTDPDPHSSAEFLPYYLAINFTYQSGGATVFCTETIHVYRPDGLTSRICSTFVDVLRLEPKLDDLHTSGDIEGFISEARIDVFQKLERLGYERKRLFNLQNLNRATTCRAAALACYALWSDQAPHWEKKGDLRNQQYEDAFAASPPSVDIQGDDDPDPAEKAAPVGVAYIIR